MSCPKNTAWPQTPKQLKAGVERLGSLKAVCANSDRAWGAIHKLYKQALAEGVMQPIPQGTKGEKNRPPAHELTPAELVELYEKHGSLRAVARNTKHSERQVRKAHKEAVALNLTPPIPSGTKTREQKKATPPPALEGRVRPPRTPSFDLPEPGKIRRYFFSCAQNNTKLHEGLWANLAALAEHYDATFHIARFTYHKRGLGAKGDKAAATGRPKTSDVEDFWWDPRLAPHFSDERAEVAPGLVWCGELNILPTAVNPLSGLQVYTGQKSSIVPHVKLALESVPTSDPENAKFNYTTGAVTLRNYVQKKAGQKAEFHHAFAALLVEVDHEGNWFARQLNADTNGTIYDLDVRAKGGEVTTGHRLEAINWGDIHHAQIDPVVDELAWGKGGMLDTLKPKYQLMHDALDFRGRSHHEVKNPHVMFKRHQDGQTDVKAEVTALARWLRDASRPWSKTVVVSSNHHDHIGRWLCEQDARFDPVNAEYWLALQRRVYAAIREKRYVAYLHEALLEVDAKAVEGIRFLRDDESFVLCPRSAGDGIEAGMHGHLGPNGSRASPKSFARMGRRANTGHTHSCWIVEGVFVAGTCEILRPDWLKGPSSWSHSHILTYANGKRAISTMRNGYWAAGRGLDRHSYNHLRGMRDALHH